MPKKNEPTTQVQAPVSPLNESTAAELVEMLQWWKAHKDGFTAMTDAPQKLETRPTFQRTRTATKTIRVSEELIKRAEKEARRQKALTGGSLSGLIEVLLWRFLGSPDDLIVEED
jgi:hypothetical protein